MNPTDIENFSFQLYYEYPTDPDVWAVGAFVVGQGQEGLDMAQSYYDQILPSQEAGQVRNLKVQYSSIVVWTDWQQDAPA